LSSLKFSLALVFKQTFSLLSAMLDLQIKKALLKIFLTAEYVKVCGREIFIQEAVDYVHFLIN
jgi:hypothetical protein